MAVARAGVEFDVESELLSDSALRHAWGPPSFVQSSLLDLVSSFSLKSFRAASLVYGQFGFHLEVSTVLEGLGVWLLLCLLKLLLVL